MLSDMGFLPCKNMKLRRMNKVERTVTGILSVAHLTAVHLVRLFSEDESVGEKR
jgi:hypothetical protein